MKQKHILSIEQCKVLMAQMSLRDKSMFLAIVACGAEARTWTWLDAIEKSLDMPIRLWIILRDYADSRGLVLPTITDTQKIKDTEDGIQVHWVSGPVYQDAIWTAKSGILARLVKGKVIKTKVTFAQPLTTQEITRRMKRYARLTGLQETEVNLRTVINTHHSLMNLYGDEEKVAEALGISKATRITPAGTGKAGVAFVSVTNQALAPASGRRVERDPRLHGIGRRSKSHIPVR